MKNEKETLSDWIKLRAKIDFAKNRPLGEVLGAVFFLLMVLTILAGIVSLLFLLGALIGIGPFAGDHSAEAIRNLGLLIVAVFSAPFLVWRTVVAQVQANTAEQGLITERISKAVEGLGSVKSVKRQRKRITGKLAYENGEDGKPDLSRPMHEEVTDPNLEVRTGALFALERISQDSPRDYLQIIEVLCAYIRQNAPANELEPPHEIEQRPDVRIDIQTAIKILARRSKEQVTLERQNRFRLDLRSSNLSGVDFEGGNFSATMFHESRLDGAILNDCNLEGSQFFGTCLNYADFFRARLVGTRFDNAILNLPIIGVGTMSESITFAEIHSIIVLGADLSQVNYLGEPENTNKTFGTKDTKLHDDIEFSRKSYDRKWAEIKKIRDSGENTLADENEIQLTGSENFVFWCPYDSSDLACGYLLRSFMDRFGLNYWPHTSHIKGADLGTAANGFRTYMKAKDLQD